MVLRKRIFLTDRMEVIEKILIDQKIISELELANQQVELTTSEQAENFKDILR